jgi:hypothetical protein
VRDGFWNLFFFFFSRHLLFLTQFDLQRKFDPPSPPPPPPGKLPKDKTPRLTGGVTLQDIPTGGGAGGGGADTSALVDIAVGFKVPMFVASGIRVADLGITGEKYKPYKGVRSVTRAGRFHVRT